METFSKTKGRRRKSSSRSKTNGTELTISLLTILQFDILFEQSEEKRTADAVGDGDDQQADVRAEKTNERSTDRTISPGTFAGCREMCDMIDGHSSDEMPKTEKKDNKFFHFDAFLFELLEHFQSIGKGFVSIGSVPFQNQFLGFILCSSHNSTDRSMTENQAKQKEIHSMLGDADHDDDERRH